MASQQTIRAGDTSDVWEIGLVTSPVGTKPPIYAALGVGDSCWLTVPGAFPPIAREVTAKDVSGRLFLAWLTPAETLALFNQRPGAWQIGLELRMPGLVPALVREIDPAPVVKIVAGLVPPA